MGRREKSPIPGITRRLTIGDRIITSEKEIAAFLRKKRKRSVEIASHLDRINIVQAGLMEIRPPEIGSLHIKDEIFKDGIDNPVFKPHAQISVTRGNTQNEPDSLFADVGLYWFQVGQNPDMILLVWLEETDEVQSGLNYIDRELKQKHHDSNLLAQRQAEMAKLKEIIIRSWSSLKKTST